MPDQKLEERAKNFLREITEFLWSTNGLPSEFSDGMEDKLLEILKENLKKEYILGQQSNEQHLNTELSSLKEKTRELANLAINILFKKNIRFKSETRRMESQLQQLAEQLLKELQ